MKNGFKFEGQVKNGKDIAINSIIVFPQLGTLLNKSLKGLKFKDNTIKMLLHGKEVETQGFLKEGKNYIHVEFLEELGYRVSNKGKMPVIEYK